MLTEICAEIRNYFTYDQDKKIGTWRIEDGQITPSIDFPTEYIRIVGSHKNDGVHCLSDANDILADEEFQGGIWCMSIPPAFIALANEIAEWQSKYGGADSQALSPFQSESFGGYSYSKASGGSSNGYGSSAPTWQSTYAKRLNIYRKI